MPLINYVSKTFSPQHQEIIDNANTIIANYLAQGYDLTLRQLYYQFVAQDLFPTSWQDATTGSTNNEKSYKKLGGIVSDARRAGLIDWERIVDRTRFVRVPPSWDTPSDIVSACAGQFDIDWWADQPFRPEVWVEKDALVGVLEVACEPWHCPYFSCRGYASDSEIWSAARRLERRMTGRFGPKKTGQKCIIFHLGDHDPSGMDMTRDVQERIKLFLRDKELRSMFELKRIALNMDQIEQYNPPPNPAKSTDTRYRDYEAAHGDESWELDALSPDVLAQLIADEMDGIIDTVRWTESEQRRDAAREQLRQVADQWETVVSGLNDE